MAGMKSCVLIGVLFLASGVMLAQSRESANQSGVSIQAGVEFSAYNADFYCPNDSPFSCGNGRPLIKGVGVFVDYNQRAKWGAEGEGRWLHWDGFDGQIESSLLIGPRYRLVRWHGAGFWAKFLVGRGDITTAGYPAPDTAKGTLFVYAPGVSVDIPFARRLSARVDYEAQKWPNFAVLPPHNHSISPNGFSVGVAYRMLR